MGDNWFLFKPGSTGTSGGGTSSGSYVQDMFSDTSLPATNNANFTSNVSVNPFGKFFNDNDSPKYGAKTLYIKDAQLIDDRRLWINNQPTYQLIFTESAPYLFAYA